MTTQTGAERLASIRAGAEAVTQPKIDYDALYRALAQKPGFEELVDPCPPLLKSYWSLPPEAERLGRLVRVALPLCWGIVVDDYGEHGVGVWLHRLGPNSATVAPQPWQALAAALAAALMGGAA